MTYQVTSYEVRQIAFSTSYPLNTRLTSSNSYPLQLMSQIYEASIYKAKVFKFNSSIAFTLLPNVI